MSVVPSVAGAEESFAYRQMSVKPEALLLASAFGITVRAFDSSDFASFSEPFNPTAREIAAYPSLTDISFPSIFMERFEQDAKTKPAATKKNIANLSENLLLLFILFSFFYQFTVTVTLSVVPYFLPASSVVTITEWGPALST